MSSDDSDKVGEVKVSEVDAPHSRRSPSLVHDESSAEEGIVDGRSVGDLMGKLIDGGLTRT